LAAPLSRAITSAAKAVERGEPLDDALADTDWFDAEFRALLKAGQTSGELDAMLERLAERETRRATRLIGRFAALLEPTVILCLVALVGLIALAALLPLIKMKEIL
jgi:general secretion pathway protein F